MRLFRSEDMELVSRQDEVNFYGLTPVAFAATSYARPLAADDL
jgi:hypothetical protein